VELNNLFYPVYGQVLLTFFLLFRMGFLRVKAIRTGKVKFKDIALGQNAWPENVTKTANCFHNQLETPILLYLAITFIGFTGKADTAYLVLATIFFFFRLLHAFEEITRNDVRRRFTAFLLGSITLLVIWLRFIVQML